MKCKHPKWRLDENSKGTCVKCGATKQFPVEKKLILRPSEASAMGSIAADSKVNTDSWLHAELHLEEKI